MRWIENQIFVFIRLKRLFEAGFHCAVIFIPDNASGGGGRREETGRWFAAWTTSSKIYLLHRSFDRHYEYIIKCINTVRNPKWLFEGWTNAIKRPPSMSPLHLLRYHCCASPPGRTEVKTIQLWFEHWHSDLKSDKTRQDIHNAQRGNQ